MAEASDFKLGTQLRFAKAHYKTTRTRKVGLHVFGLGKLSYIWGFPLLFLQRPRCPLSVSGASCFSRRRVPFKYRYWHIGPKPNDLFDQIWRKGVPFGTLVHKFSTSTAQRQNLKFSIIKCRFCKNHLTLFSAVIAPQKL